MTDDTRAGERNGKRAASLRWLSNRIGLWILVGLVPATVGGFLARWSWWFDLLVHFRVQLLVAGSIATAALVIGRSWRLAGLATVSTAVNLVQVVPLWVPTGTSSDAGAGLRVISVNVLTSNRDHAAVLEFLTDERPDVVAVLEVDRSWLPVLDELREDFPHQARRLREDNFGIALVSRHPFRASSNVPLTAEGLPTIVSEIAVGGSSIHVFATHPVPPMGNGNWTLRNRQLRSLAERVREIDGPTIVVGDLNITPWSPFFGDLLSDGGLVDARGGFGVQPTWPARPWLLRIPIDHVLVTRDVAVRDFRFGPDVGSDHRPVVVDVEVPASGSDLLSAGVRRQSSSSPRPDLVPSPR